MEVKQGQEVQLIDAWNDSYNEIDELKKLFLEFLKRWVENDGREKKSINALVIYRRKPGHPFSLTESDRQNDKYLK